MEKESALLGLADSQEAMFFPNRSHSSICEFGGEHDPVWEQVSDILCRGASAALSYSGYSSVAVGSKTTLDNYPWCLQGKPGVITKTNGARALTRYPRHAQNILADPTEDPTQSGYQTAIQLHSFIVAAKATWLLSYLMNPFRGTFPRGLISIFNRIHSAAEYQGGRRIRAPDCRLPSSSNKRSMRSTSRGSIPCKLLECFSLRRAP